MVKPISEGGYGKTEDDLWTRYHVKIGADRQRVVAGGGEQRSERSGFRSRYTDARQHHGPKRKWSTTVRRPTSSPRFLKMSFRLATNWWAMAF